MRVLPTTGLLLCALSVNASVAAQPAPMSLTDGSIFAVITHRGGLAGSLAHNHFVVADRFLADFTFDAETPANSTLRFNTLTEDLKIDDPELQAAWIDRIRALELVEEFGDLDEGDRAKVRAQMLDEDQLDPDNYGVIGAQVTSISEGVSQIGDVSFDYVATVDVTIHGNTVTRDVPARYEQTEAGVRFEAVGRFEFKEFGIKPYSAFLGTVKVKNDFEIYINVTAVRADPEG